MSSFWNQRRDRVWRGNQVLQCLINSCKISNFLWLLEMSRERNGNINFTFFFLCWSICHVTPDSFLELWQKQIRDNWEEGNPDSWVATSPQYQVRYLPQVDLNMLINFLNAFSMFVMWTNCHFSQPGSPPSRTYEAPTPGSGWASTPGGNYSEAGTPRDSTPAYGISVEEPLLSCHSYG